MLRLFLLLLILTGFEASACWTPRTISGGVIEMNYLDVGGKYTIKLPASIGEATRVSAGLFYKKLDSSKADHGEFGAKIKLHLVGETLIGEFSAFSKLGYEAWIDVTWHGLDCPIKSRKKVKLFPPNA
jgi:hypothetical protein